MIKEEDLKQPDEANILQNIKSKFESKQIYTQCGIVLLSVNPFSEIKIYEKNVMKAYYRNFGSVEPHVYSVAENAIQNLPINGNQTIIISGESGSGKTENAKHLLKYLIWRCQGNSNLEELLLSSHFILECFGNAKTQINENSSRFGKYLTLFFENGIIIGGKIEEYLLEKSRITHQSKNDKNFHIFYLILAGMNLSLQNDYIKHKFTEDDLKRFKKLENIFEKNDLISFDTLKQKILSIINLGSLKFIQNEDALEILNEEILEEICINFNLEFGKIKHSLCKNVLCIKNEVMERNNSLEQAVNIRDTLARHLYYQVFQLVIHSINEKLGGKSESSISILDIYGFEVFEENGFDQFCINWANERIQNEFVRRMFIERQNFYKNEEVAWPDITFSSNDEVIELLEGNLGIADLVEEESLNPCGSTNSLLIKINNFNKKRSKLLPTTTPGSIKIDHFAYPVEYLLDDFIEKNMENHKNLKFIDENLCIKLDKFTSNQIDFSDIQEERALNFNSTNEKVKLFDKISKDNEGSFKLNNKEDNQKNISFIKSFIESMNQLFKVINSTEIHYIRCIRPNRNKEPWNFDSSYVNTQLTTCGIKEITELSRQIYPHIILKNIFHRRYKLINMNSNLFLDGKNYIFVKTHVLKNLEEQRNKQIDLCNGLIVKFMQYFSLHKFIIKVKKSQKINSLKPFKSDHLINESELLNKLENIRSKSKIELEEELQHIKHDIKNILNFYKLNYKNINLKYKYQTEELKKTKQLENEINKLKEINNKLSNEIIAHKELIKDITIIANEVRKEEHYSNNDENVLNINLNNPHEIFSCLIEIYIKNAPLFSNNNVPLNEILSLGHLVYKLVTELSQRYKVNEMSYLNVFIYELNEKIIQFDLSLQNVTFFLSNLLELLTLFNKGINDTILVNNINDTIINNSNENDNSIVNNLTNFISTLFQHMCELQKESISHMIPDSIIYYQPLDKFRCDDNFFKKYFKSNHSVYKLINQLDYLCNMMYYFGIPSSFVKESLNYLLKSINVNCFNRILIEQNFINFNRATQINFNLNEISKFIQEIGFTEGLDALRHTKDVVVLVFLLKNGEDHSSIQSECTSLNVSQLNTFFAKIEGINANELKNESKEINIFLDDPVLNIPLLSDKHDFIFCLPRYLPSKQITALLSSI